MKGKKNLEKAIVLGLLLSTSVYGTVWAEITYNIDETGKLIINTDENITNDKTFNDKKLNEFDEIEINLNTDKDEVRAVGIWSQRYNLQDSNLTVKVTSGGENNDAIHLSSHAPWVEVESFTAYVNSPISDAINISSDATSASEGLPHVTINNNLTAVVEQGNGIRANASTDGSMLNNSTVITVKGNTDITINADKSSNIARPTAVWAGDSQRYFLFWGSETKGKGEIYLYGNTKLTLNGNGNYGIFAGKNGSIDINNLNVLAKGTNSYGISATNDNIIYGTSFDQSQNRYGSTVTLNGDTNTIIMGVVSNDGTVTKAEGSKAIYADSQYGVVKSGDGGIGKFDIVGDIVAENGGTITLDVTGDEQNYLQGDIIAFGTESQKMPI